MQNISSKKKGIPRIESLKVQNFRALKNVTLDKLTPMTVLLGPNGSGKSTIFDVFNFLAECFQYGLRHAWDRRGSKGQSFRFLEFHRGIGKAVSGEVPDVDDVRTESNLTSPDLIAVNTLGQLSDHPRIPDGHFKIPHLWPGQNPPATEY